MQKLCKAALAARRVWNTLGFRQQTAFDARLTASVGLGSVSPLPKGALVMAPFMLSQLQSRPFNSS